MSEAVKKEEQRAVATWEALQTKGLPLKHKWLSELEGCAELCELLGGDACVIAYSALDWAQFTEHRTFDGQGQLVPDEPKRAAHQFTFVLRQGPSKDAPHVIPMSEEGMTWVNRNLSNHYVDLVRRISDELSGWDPYRDPFGKLRNATGPRLF